MTQATLIRPATLRTSFSFYLSPNEMNILRASLHLPDAIVVSGAAGTQAVTELRRSVKLDNVLFDRGCYQNHLSVEISPQSWFEQQSDAGADRVLTPGRWIPWSGNDDALEAAVSAESDMCKGAGPATTVLLAIDSRWLTKDVVRLANALNCSPNPKAIVLSHRADPLGPGGSVTGLLALNSRVADLTYLRSDHGAIGAIAFGAVHGAIGLRSVFRHFVPPDAKAGGIPNDRTPRLFVRDLMDWFSASTVAGWGASNVNVACNGECCRGQRLERFLDDRLVSESRKHNLTVLSELADEVLDCPTTDRRRFFASLCADALENYGPMGKLSEVTKAKSQLEQWAQFF